MRHQKDLHALSPVPLGYSRSASYLLVGSPGHASRHLASWANCCFHHWFRPHILPFFTTSINSNLCGQTLHIKYYVYVHGPFSELLAVSGRETWSFTFMSWLPRRLREKKFKSNFFKQNFIWWKYANSTQWWIPQNLAREEKSWVCLPQRSIFVHLHFLR